MKSVLIALTCFALILTATKSYAADPPPAFNAVAVAQLAQKDLEDRGLHTGIFVASIEYKGLLGEPYWSVYWSKPFASDSTKGAKEVGLKVQLDGNYVRLVRKRK
jgi:hypothetical protein